MEKATLSCRRHLFTKCNNSTHPSATLTASRSILENWKAQTTRSQQEIALSNFKMRSVDDRSSMNSQPKSFANSIFASAQCASKPLLKLTNN